MIRLFSRYILTRDILFFITEGFVISLGVLLAIGIRFSFDSETINSYEYITAKILFITVVCQTTLLYNELYFTNLGDHNRTLFIKLLQSLGATSILLAISYFFFPSLIIGRGIFILTIIVLPPLLFIWRTSYREIPVFKKNKERILILGTGNLALEIGKKIFDKGHADYMEVVGYLDEDKSRVGESLFNPKIIGTHEEILSIVERARIDRIIVALTEMRGMLPIGPLLKLRLDGVGVEDGVSFYEKISGKIHVSHLKPGWLIFSDGFRRRQIEIGKRIIDILLAIIGLLLASPVMFITALLIKLDSPGPILFRQERVGEGGRIFPLLKFRSMKADAESGSGPVWAELNDHRITRVGHLIRKLRIDESPQMINVLRGEMSFVGPRPERPYFVAKLKKKIPYYSLRHTVKPGITGWAQIKYPYGASVRDALEKLQYDIYYIKNMTILFDLTIVLETIKTIVMGTGAR